MTPYTVDQAKERVTNYAKTRYPRGPQNDEEWQKIGAGINYDDGVDETELQTAYGNTDALAASYGVAPTPAQTPVAATTPAPVTAQAPPSPQVQQNNTNVWNRLNEAMTQVQQYNPAAPENKMALDVQRANSQRAAERRRAAAAERAAATTGTTASGGFETTVDAIEADRGLDDASFEAQLARDFTENQRSDRNEALRLGTGLLSQDVAGTRQDRYTDLDAALRREGYGTQMSIAQLDAQLRREGLSVQKLLGMGDIGTRILSILTGDRQANDRLGYDYTRLQTGLDQALYDALGN